jgi:formylglycine-generating enzyme required for sulfatase activity
MNTVLRSVLCLAACVTLGVEAARGDDSVTPARVGAEAGEARDFAGMTFVWIPPGDFMMGSETGDDDERPVHRVTISRGFWMGKYEVTKAQWETVMDTRPWEGEHYVNPDPDSPASHLSFAAAESFATRLNEKGYGRFRLPTEAEWEYACRAGSTTAFPFGDDPGALSAHAWYKANAMDAGTKHALPVGQRVPNAWGLHDMMGNVYEWCADWYGADYYERSPAADPVNTEPGVNHVVRGGAWFYLAEKCRSANRVCYPSSGADGRSGGLRIVLAPGG